MMKLTFLGTGSSIPTAKRNHAGILLSYAKENILIDCGEGIQRQFRKAKLSPMKLTKILITHWHGDHVLGIPGILQTLSLNNYRKTLEVYGPKGTKNFMKSILKAFAFSGKIKLQTKEIFSGKFIDEKDFYLETSPMSHGVPTLAYNFVKKGQLKIDKNKLAKTKLPNSKLIYELKKGKNIVYNGKKYFAKDLTYSSKGKKISVVMDTAMNKNIVSFVKDADILAIESTFLDELRKQAEEHKHMTAKQDAEIAKKAKVGKLFLVHLSQRYDKNPKKILDESKKIFKNSFLPDDLDSIEV